MTWVIWVKGVKQGSGGDFQSVELISLKSQFHLWTSKRIWHDHNSSKASLKSTGRYFRKNSTAAHQCKVTTLGGPLKTRTEPVFYSRLVSNQKIPRVIGIIIGLSQHPALPLSWYETWKQKYSLLTPWLSDWWSIESKNVGSAFETFLGHFYSSAKVVFNAAFSAEMWH